VDELLVDVIWSVSHKLNKGNEEEEEECLGMVEE
jgi:hypothetical protein